MIELDQYPRNSPPRVVATTDLPGAATGVPHAPCGRCGCAFVSVVCPNHFPVEVVALVCFACGRSIAFVDGVLLITVRQALRESTARPWVVKHRTAKSTENESLSPGRLRELVDLGRRDGLSDADIAEALGISEEEVRGLR